MSVHRMRLVLSGLLHVVFGFVKTVPGIGFVDFEQDPIGEGSYGVVFKGSRVEDDSLIALKVEKSAGPNPCVGRSAPAGLTSLDYEVGLAKQMQNETGFPRVVADGTDKGFRWAAFSFIGPSITQLAKRRKLEDGELMDYGIQILTRLEALHAQGYLMYDVHGGNFLLAPNGTVFAIDLGFAYQWKVGNRLVDNPIRRECKQRISTSRNDLLQRPLTPKDDVERLVLLLVNVARLAPLWLRLLYHEIRASTVQVPDYDRLRSFIATRGRRPLVL